MLFTNQSGEKTVYYGCDTGRFFAASHVTLLAELMKEQCIPVEPELGSCRQLMICGDILHGGTPLRGVRRLTAGKYLLVSRYQPVENRYHMFRNLPEHDLSLEECVEELDRRFRTAVDRIFAKNREYGYQAECDLSGGLDSRLATWVAHDLGYTDMLNICYCQSGKIDHKTSRKIAKDLDHEYFFLPMDGGGFLMDVDQVTEKFGGQVTYLICTGANQAMQEIARHEVGLCVTGLLGEIHNAYWVQGDTHTPPDYIANRYSDVVPVKIPEVYKADYDNFEQMNLYEYSMLLFMSSALVRQQQCEVTSPFVDVDFLEFAYRVPLKWRRNYLLTMTWMVKKYPECAEYVWQTKKMPVSSYYHHKKFYLPKAVGEAGDLLKRMCNKAFRLTNIHVSFALSDEMNPFEVWYRSNAELRRFIEDYFKKNLPLVRDDLLRRDIQKTYDMGGARDKLQVIALLSVFKLYFA